MSAADRANPSSESIKIDAHELYALSKQLENADKKLRRKLNKALKKAADEGVQAARLEVLKEPPARLGASHKGIRLYRNKDGSVRSRVVITRFDEKSGGRSRHTGLRQNIASAITAKVATSSSRETTVVRITMNGNKVPQGSGVAKAYNKGKPFRHPVFADPSKTRDRWSWAYQQGRPYFGSVLLAHKEQTLRNIAAAMDEFANEI
jgi:hypothetical protein